MTSVQNRPTTLEELKKYTQGELVELPEFAEGQPFVARLRRPSLLNLVKTGKIPNTLLNTANKLFYGKGDSDEESDVDNDSLRKVFELFDIICEASFVEPTYKQIKESGISLSDDQFMFIFNYSQQGVKALEPFRK